MPRVERPARPAPLPEAVMAVIDTASIHVRPDTGDDAGADTAIVQLPGWSGFKFSPEAAANVAARAWPELSEIAVGQAVRRLAGLVAARRRQHAQDRAAMQRGLDADTRPWMARY
jgi:hypothetical protein